MIFGTWTLRGMNLLLFLRLPSFGAWRMVVSKASGFYSPDLGGFTDRRGGRRCALMWSGRGEYCLLAQYPDPFAGGSEISV